MTVDEAVRAVAAMIAGMPALRVARHGIREDDTHYLVPVLDGRQMRRGGAGVAPSASQLLLVEKESGRIERVTVSQALARSRVMRAVGAAGVLDLGDAGGQLDEPDDRVRHRVEP